MSRRVLLLLVALSSSACSQDDAGSPAGDANPCPLALTEVATGLSMPVFVTSPPGDSRLFVVEQGGAIRIVDQGALRAKPFLDVGESIAVGNEQGLLGLAFDPLYAQSGRFWVHYTDLQGDSVIAQHGVSADANVAEPDPDRVLLKIEQPFPNHNGGMLAFGPDGLLYVGIGDGGSAGDPLGNGQNPGTKLGKLLRLDVDTHPQPPPGNWPGADPDVWAIGLRNPWRFSFDRETGALWVADVGQASIEEVNVVEPGSAPPNFGWKTMEGSRCFEPASDCDRSGLMLPVAEYDHGLGCSVTGGYVYRGSGVECLQGTYLFADFCTSRVWGMRYEGGVADPPRELTRDVNPGGAHLALVSSFGEDAAGELYLVSYDDGRVLRIAGE